MKNTVFWDINTQFVPHRKPNTSPIQSRADKCYVISEVFTALTTKNAVFWDIITQFIPHRRYITLFYRVQPVNAM
jgi:hypothetical protein